MDRLGLPLGIGVGMIDAVGLSEGRELSVLVGQIETEGLSEGCVGKNNGKRPINEDFTRPNSSTLLPSFVSYLN